MSIEEEIWQRTQDLIMRGEDKKLRIVVYLGDRDWCEFIDNLDMCLRHTVRDDTYLGKPMMFGGAMVLRVATESHRNITAISPQYHRNAC